MSPKIICAELRDLSSNAYRLYDIFARIVRWDTRKPDFGVVAFSYADLGDFVRPAWGKSTFKRATRELEQAGKIRRLARGRYRFTDTPRIIPEKFAAALAKGPRVGHEGPRVAQQGPQVDHEGPHMAPRGAALGGKSSLETPRDIRDRRSTGDLSATGTANGYGARSIELGPEYGQHPEPDRARLCEAMQGITKTAGWETASAVAAVLVAFHKDRIHRRHGCTSRDCIERALEKVAVSMEKAVKPAPYLEKALRNLIEDQDEERAKAAEAARDEGPDAGGLRPADFGSLGLEGAA